jgi:hypothetical protein
MNISETILSNLEEALLVKDTRLHAFRSGGGLRVIRMEADFNLIAYGESPWLPEAFRILNDDYNFYLKNGHRRGYDEVYGQNEDHYLTGDPIPSDDPVEKWILRGNSFDCYRDFATKQFVFSLTGFKEGHTLMCMRHGTRYGRAASIAEAVSKAIDAPYENEIAV